MRNVMGYLLLAVAGVALGQSPPPAAKPAAASVEKANADAKTLMQMERDWTQAGIKKDTVALDKMLADDWTALDFQGNTVTKAQSLADYKAGASTVQSVDLGEMKVKVFGNTAVVTGSDTEKSTYKGKDSSGKYVWTDVFVNRNGRWQAVASQSAKVDK